MKFDLLTDTQRDKYYFYLFNWYVLSFLERSRLKTAIWRWTQPSLSTTTITVGPSTTTATAETKKWIPTKSEQKSKTKLQRNNEEENNCNKLKDTLLSKFKRTSSACSEQFWKQKEKKLLTDDVFFKQQPKVPFSPTKILVT
jgi:hypothetical protein